METRLEHALEYSRMAAKARKKQARKKAKEVGAMIYFIQAGEYIKVGISSRKAWYHRLSNFQVSNPHEIRVLKLLKTSEPRKDEARFHELLKMYHVRGEWFKVENMAILELLGVVPARP